MMTEQRKPCWETCGEDEAGACSGEPSCPDYRPGYRWYKIGPHNSTVAGSPGRLFDWSHFCWDGSAVYSEICGIPGHPVRQERAPLPYTDSFDPATYEYLHVPYKWAETRAVYRVRAASAMGPGRVYRGHRVDRQRAVLRDGVWWWVLESDD